MRITVLGGYGNAGSEIVRLAARFTEHTLTVAGRDGSRVESKATELSEQTGKRINWVRCDAESENELRRAADDCDLLLVASSTIHLTDVTARACLDAGINYMDIGLSTPEKWRVLRKLEAEIIDRRLTFISDGGFHPGLPGFLIQCAAARIPDLESAVVGGSFAMDWKGRTISPSTENEFAEEVSTAELTMWKDGRWETGYRNAREFDFGEPIGRSNCIPMMMEEVREIVAELPSLRETGFFISGFGPVVDYLIMPVCMAGFHMGDRMRGYSNRLFAWGLERFASGPEYAMLQLEAVGCAEAEKWTVQIRHDDPYVLTAAPVVACLRQIQSRNPGPGLFTQASLLDPEHTLEELQGMGVSVKQIG